MTREQGPAFYLDFEGCSTHRHVLPHAPSLAGSGVPVGQSTESRTTTDVIGREASDSVLGSACGQVLGSGAGMRDGEAVGLGAGLDQLATQGQPVDDGRSSGWHSTPLGHPETRPSQPGPRLG